MDRVLFEKTDFPEDRKPRHEEDNYWRTEYTKLSQKYADLKCSARKLAVSINGSNSGLEELSKELVELKKQVVYWQQQHSKEVDMNEQLRYELANPRVAKIDTSDDVSDMAKVNKIATLCMKLSKSENLEYFG